MPRKMCAIGALQRECASPDAVNRKQSYLHLYAMVPAAGRATFFIAERPRLTQWTLLATADKAGNATVRGAGTSKRYELPPGGSVPQPTCGFACREGCDWRSVGDWHGRHESRVVADAAAEVANPGNKAHLRNRRPVVAARKQIANLGDLAFDRCIEVLLAELLAGRVLEGSNILADDKRWSGQNLSICDAETEGIEVAVFETVLALDEHLQGFCLIGPYGGDRALQHCLGFGRGAAGCPLLGECRRRQGQGGRRHTADHKAAKHTVSPLCCTVQQEALATASGETLGFVVFWAGRLQRQRALGLQRDRFHSNRIGSWCVQRRHEGCVKLA